jgi:hypothetical protein
MNWNYDHFEKWDVESGKICTPYKIHNYSTKINTKMWCIGETTNIFYNKL